MLVQMLAGPAELNGCPDTDGDGIADKDDACPEVAGLAALQGCPDADGDGVADNKDKCPTVSRSKRKRWLSLARQRWRSVLDKDDKCPDVKQVLLLTMVVQKYLRRRNEKIK